MSVSELHSQSNPAIQSDWQYAHALLFLFPLPYLYSPLHHHFSVYFSDISWFVLLFRHFPQFASFFPPIIRKFSLLPLPVTQSIEYSNFWQLTKLFIFQKIRSLRHLYLHLPIVRVWNEEGSLVFLPVPFLSLYILYSPPIDSLTPHLSVCLWCLCFPSLNSFATRSC